MWDFEYLITWWVVQALSYVFTCDCGFCISKLQGGRAEGHLKHQTFAEAIAQRGQRVPVAKEPCTKETPGKKIVTKNGNSVLHREQESRTQELKIGSRNDKEMIVATFVQPD
jgi:hypothetical protein